MLANYINLKRHWEISTCYENSPIKEFVKNNNNNKSLVSFNIYRKDIINFYNCIIDICIGNIKNEINKYEEKINKIKKSKDKKELQEIVNVSSYYMDNTDFNTIKHFLINWYQTKIKHYEEELNTSSYCRGKSQIL